MNKIHRSYLGRWTFGIGPVDLRIRVQDTFTTIFAKVTFPGFYIEIGAVHIRQENDTLARDPKQRGG